MGTAAPMQRWLQVQDDQRELSNLLWAEKPCKIGPGEVRIQKVSFAAAPSEGILLLMPRAEP